MKNAIEFTNAQIELLARYTAELTRQGIVFVVSNDGHGFKVTHTGGF